MSKKERQRELIRRFLHVVAPHYFGERGRVGVALEPLPACLSALTVWSPVKGRWVMVVSPTHGLADLLRLLLHELAHLVLGLVGECRAGDVGAFLEAAQRSGWEHVCDTWAAQEIGRWRPLLAGLS